MYEKGAPEVKDVEPKHIFALFNTACLLNGEGSVKYYWPKVLDGKNTEVGYLKMSHIRLFLYN